MPPIPFLGRLNMEDLSEKYQMSRIANFINRAEYIALVGSFLLVGLEAIIRILTLALRT